MPELLIRDGLVRGGFAEVYRGVLRNAEDVPQDVAVHVLQVRHEPGLPAFDALVELAGHLARIRHPTLPQIHDLVAVDGRAALVTERSPGRDLAELLRGDGLPTRTVFEVIAQVAAALAAAWNAPSPSDGKPLRLVHRGVQPGVIRIDPTAP